MDYKQHIGLKVRELLSKKNITQTRLAEVLGTTKQHITKLLDNPDWKASKIQAVITAFEVEPAYFFEVKEVVGKKDLIIQGLEKRVEDCERIIAEKERLIGVLMGENSG
ncbi:MAG: helix-turn-helix transcriptional regulator [Bacteroidia bacterium]|nr:helix-turn-helix transcriptional regulator [Bacteroidia bacterium]